jgi:hypothetical protein
MKIVVCQYPDDAHASGAVLFEIGVNGEDHWLLRDNVSKVCDWPRGRAAGPGPVLDDADRLVIQKIYTNWYNNVIVGTKLHARLDDVERMVNNMVEILEKRKLVRLNSPEWEIPDGWPG